MDRKGFPESYDLRAAGAVPGRREVRLRPRSRPRSTRTCAYDIVPGETRSCASPTS